MQLELFSSPGCGKCGRAKDTLRDLVAEMGKDRIQWREVNILDEIDYAVDLGVLAAPSIAIDGELVFTSLPSPQRLRKELSKRMGDAQ